MNNIFEYNGKDITMNVCIQIELIADIIAKKDDITFLEALGKLYNSKTFKILKQTENGLWAESAEYIADRYYEEIDQIEDVG